MSRARDVASLLNTVATDEELTSGLSEKLSYEFASASPTTTASGFLWYDSNTSPAAAKFWDGAAFQALGGSGKILQVVRSTASYSATSSTSYTDSTASVTITPQKSDSGIIIIYSTGVQIYNNSGDIINTFVQITDSSNNTISGAEGPQHRIRAQTATYVQTYWTTTLFAYEAPASTSSQTYKVRFKIDGSGAVGIVLNANYTGQMYAIEVAS